MKKKTKFFTTAIVIVIAMSLTACGNSTSSSSSNKEVSDKTVENDEIAKSDKPMEGDEITESDKPMESNEPAESEETVKNGTYDLDDISVTFSDSVRNDVTGNWRLAKVATNTDITQYASAYHDMFIKSDQEIHAVVNFTLNTTTRISMLTSDLMDITVLEYVDGEEHDAKELFGGTLLKQYQLTLSTGALEEIQ